LHRSYGVNNKGQYKRPPSLQLRLVILAILLLTISLGMVGVALEAAFHRSSEADLQARMESTVYLVLGAIEVTDEGTLKLAESPGDPRLDQPGSGVFAVVEANDETWFSKSALGETLPRMSWAEVGGHRFQAPGEETGFYTYRYVVSWELANDRLLPVMVTIYVTPEQLEPERTAFRRGLWRSLGATGLILVLAQALLLAFGLRPLRRISQDIAGIESGSLRRLEGEYPRELETLKRNINHLLETEEANQGRYRNALDSLAHSLKTPLSVIRSSLAGEDTRKTQIIEESVDEMQHLIATRLQRAAASTRRSMAQAVDVEPQVLRLVQSLSRVYSQKMIESDVRIEPGLAFYGEQRDLLELAGNLLDNACKYGNGKVRLTAGWLDEENVRRGIWLDVEDNGKGIPEDKREWLLQRGVRGDERAEGHGLGLAIVLEIVSAYNGEIELGNSELGGVKISVTLRTS
jgi:two-component system sensor histidine kinase PhoQ